MSSGVLFKEFRVYYSSMYGGLFTWKKIPLIVAIILEKIIAPPTIVFNCQKENKNLKYTKYSVFTLPLKFIFLLSNNLEVKYNLYDFSIQISF